MCDIPGVPPSPADDLIEPIAAAGAVKKPKEAAAGGLVPDVEGLGGLRPKRACIRGVDRS
ncbi:protein of unknown function [Streptomyces murinus]